MSSYDVENLNRHMIRYTVVAGIDLDMMFVQNNIPKFTGLKVTDLNGKDLLDERDVEALLKKPISQESFTERRGALVLQKSPHELLFTTEVQIAEEIALT